MRYNLNHVNDRGKEELERKCRIDVFSNKRLGYGVYNGAYLVPADKTPKDFYQRGILSAKGEAIQSSLLYEGYNTEWVTNVRLDNAIYKKEIVIYLGWFDATWGHILTDCLKKLWFLKTAECQDLISKGAKFVCLMPWSSKSLEEILKFAEVNIQNIENVTELTQYETVYIPDNSIVTDVDGSRYYTKEYKEIIALICNKVFDNQQITPPPLLLSCIHIMPRFITLDYGCILLAHHFQNVHFGNVESMGKRILKKYLGV